MLKYNNIPNIIKQLYEVESKSLEEAAIEVQKKATYKSVVKTGRLRASISYSVNGGPTISPNGNVSNSKNEDTSNINSNEHNAVVGTNVVYAKSVEYGIGRRIAKPFLQPAYDESKQKIKHIFETNFSKVGKL